MNISRAKILYADDEPLLLEIFSHWLIKGLGATVVTASDGQEALSMLMGEDFDVLITDINMPRMNGVELVRSVAGLNRVLPSIILVSGFGSIDEREMYGLGVEAFLSKPTARETLIDAVKSALTDRSEVWRTPMVPPPRQSLSIQARDFANTALEGGVAFGRGGFSAPLSVPAAPGKVNFSCRLDARDLLLTGQGYVRWISQVDKTVGIEVAFVDDGCRATIIKEITTNRFRSFIPPK